MNSKRYHDVSEVYLGIDKYKRSTNNGNFDIIRFTTGVDAKGISVTTNIFIRTRREAGCSQDANYNSTTPANIKEIATMYIKVSDFFANGHTPKDSEKSAIEENLKDWIRFGRKVGIRAEYKGCHTISEYCKKLGVNPTGYNENNSLFFIVEWDTSDLLSSKHGLATLSFFRYFYSPKGTGIYKKCIDLANRFPSMTEMEIFWASHLIGSSVLYDPYYGFYMVPRKHLEKVDGEQLELDEDSDNSDEVGVAGSIPGIPKFRKVFQNYLQGHQLNNVWTQYLVPTIKKVTKEEYEQEFSGKISDFMWKKLVAQDMDGIQMLPFSSVTGEKISQDNFVLKLKEFDRKGILDEMIKKLDFLYV